MLGRAASGRESRGGSSLLAPSLLLSSPSSRIERRILSYPRLLSLLLKAGWEFLHETWSGISLVFPDEVKDLSTWFGIMPVFPDEVKDLSTWSGISPNSPDEVKDLPSWTGQFTYLVLIIS